MQAKKFTMLSFKRLLIPDPLCSEWNTLHKIITSFLQGLRGGRARRS